MALDTAAVWGKNVADAIKALGVTGGTPVSDSQLEAVWAAIKGEDITQLGQADVAAGAFLDGTSSPVTGIGGPVS